MPEDKECIWCDRAWALLGLIAGAGIAFMAIDLMGGGFLTRSLTTRVPKLAAVVDLPASDGSADAG